MASSIPQRAIRNVLGHGRKISKLACELIAKRYAELFGLKIATCRLSGVYGPMERWRPSRAYYCPPYIIIHRALEGLPIRINAPDGVGDHIHSQDVARAITSLLEKDGPFGHPVYNIAYGAPVTLSELVETIATLIPGLEWDYANANQCGVVIDPTHKAGRWGAYDISRIAAETGWRPVRCARRWQTTSTSSPSSAQRRDIATPAASTCRSNAVCDRPMRNEKTMSEGAVFHLAFTVIDLAATKRFYVDVLGCSPVDQSTDWLVLDFFGHKITAYRDPNRGSSGNDRPVHTDDLALRHFGAILDEPSFRDVSARLEAAGAEFIIPAEHRDAGTPQEQWIVFVKDPSGNGVEFNSFPTAKRRW